MFRIRHKMATARKTVYDGTKYDSKFEAREARDLSMLLKAGKIEGFQAHQRIPLVVNGFHVSDYYIDFVVHHPDKTIEYIETKGLTTAVWVLKWKILQAMTHNDKNVRLTLVSQKPIRLRKIRRDGNG